MGLAVVAAMVPGCLEARETDKMVYDAARDEFRLVMVLEDISGGGSDMQYLGAIQRNKDHLIAPCVPGDAFGYAPWFVRLEDHKAGKVTFSQPRAGDMLPIEVKASLGAIDVRPGAFFVAGNRLCYYHAMNVPGKTIDALIEQTRKDQLAPLKKAVEAERDRRKFLGQVYTWAQLTQQEIEAVKKDSTDHPIKPFMVMEEASLEKLVTVAGDPKKGLTRQGKDFVLNLPLTPRDRDGLVEMWGQFLKAAEAAPAEAMKSDMMDALRRLPMKAVTISAGADGAVLAIDIVKIYNAVGDAMTAYSESRSGPLKPAEAETSEVRYAREHGWTLREGITPEQVMKDFAAGTLKSYPSETVATPGMYLKVQPK